MSEELLLECDNCDRNFSSKHRWNQHIYSGVCLGKLYVCKQCFEPFERESDLLRHQRKVRNRCPKNSEMILKKIKQKDTDKESVITISIKKE